MKRVLILLTTVTLVIYLCEALECGVGNRKNRNRLKTIAAGCQRSTKTRSNEDSSSYDWDDSMESTTSQKSLKTNGKSPDTDQRYDNYDLNGDKTLSDHCVVHCVFKGLGMIGENDFPDFNLVSNVLMTSHQSSELRDFIRDTIVECFRFVEQVAELEPCIHSTALINCLVDKGRFNCADWPVGNMPFYS